jgi:hypothetical protein
MSSPPQPPPRPPRSDVEADALALLAAVFNGDEVGRKAILGHVEDSVLRGVPWQVYLGGFTATIGAHLAMELERNGVDLGEWIAGKQAELRARMAAGTAEGDS